jgi:FkbM family methyltransferase
MLGRTREPTRIFGLDCGAEVIAIEPNQQSRELLLANLALNDYACTVLSCALWDKPGTVRFTTDLDVANRISAEGVEVEARTLDDIVGERYVNGIKLDIEGAEFFALHGAKKLLQERRVKALQLEWSDMSLKTLGQDRIALGELLQSHGYFLSRPDVNGRLRELETLDFGRDGFATRDHPT